MELIRKVTTTNNKRNWKFSNGKFEDMNKSLDPLAKGVRGENEMNGMTHSGSKSNGINVSDRKSKGNPIALLAAIAPS